MPIKAVLFDLDGTLLPMDQDVFITTYFNRIAEHILATNPLFPTVATKSRIRWVGLEPEDFECPLCYARKEAFTEADE